MDSTDNIVKQPFTKRLKVGFYETFLHLEKSFSFGIRTAFILELIVCLQLLSLIFISDAHWVDNDALNTLAEIVAYTRLDFLLAESGSKIITFYGTLALCFLFAAIGAYVCVEASMIIRRRDQMHSQHLRESGFYTIFRSIFSWMYFLFSTVLYIPILSILSMAISCAVTGENSLSHAKCIYSPNLVEMIVSIAAAVLFILVLVGTKLVHYQRGAYSANYTYMEVLYLISKTAVVFIFQLGPMSGLTPMALAIVFILLTGATLFVFMNYLPFKSFTMNQIRCAILTSLLWGGVCLLVTVFQDDRTQAGPMYLLFIGVVIAAALGFMMAHSRRERMLAKLPTSISSIFDMDLKVRLTRSASAHSSSVDDVIAKEFLEAGDAASHLVNDNSVEWMERFVSTNSSALASCILMNLYFESNAHGKEGVQTLYRLQKQNIRLELDYLVYRQNKITKAQMLQDEESDKVLHFLALQRGQDQAVQEDILLLREQIAFWGELLSKRPQQNLLTRLTGSIRHQTIVTRNIFESLLTRGDNLPSILELYGDFLIHSSNDEVSGNMYTNRAKAIQAKQSQSESQRDESIELFAEDATLIVSSNDKRVGIIEEASAGCGNLFGCLPQILVGTAFHTVFPGVVSETLSQTLSEGISKHFVDGVELYVNHASGYMIPVFIFARDIPKISSHTSSIVVIRDKSRHDEKLRNVCLVDMKTSCVMAVTGGFCDTYDLDLAAVKNQSIKMGKLFPFMTADNISTIIKEGSTYSFEGTTYDVQVKLNESTDGSEGYYVIKVIKVETDQSHEGHRQSVSHAGRSRKSSTVDFAFKKEMNADLVEVNHEGDSKRGSQISFERDIKEDANLGYSDDDSDADMVGEDRDMDRDMDGKKIKQDQKSNGSSSAASTAPERQFLKSLRGALNDDGTMLPIIRRFFQIFLVSTFVICATAIFSFVYILSLTNTYETHANLNEVGLRRFLVANMAVQGDTLAMIAEGAINDTDGSKEAKCRGLLTKNSQKLEDIEIKLEKFDRSEDHEQLYRVPSVNIHVARDGVVHYEKLNMRDVEQKMISSARAIVEKPLTDISNTPTDEDTYFVTKNGAFNAIISINQSTFEYTHANDEEILAIENISMILMIFALIVIVGVNTFVIYPTIKKVEDNKNAVMDMFLTMPKAALRMLRSQAVERCERLSKLLSDSDQADGIDFSAMGGDVGGGDDSESGQSKRRILSEFKIRILSRVGLFSVVAALYFILAHFLAFMAFEHRLLEGPPKVNYAGYRRASSTRIIYLVRNILMADRHVNGTYDKMYEEAMHEISLLGATNADLVYGNAKPKGGVRHLEEVESYKSSDHTKILFEDACFKINVAVAGGADAKALCESYDYGVLTGGLQAGFIKMLSIAQNVAKKFHSLTPTQGSAPLTYSELKTILKDPQWVKLYEYGQNAIPSSIGSSLGLYNKELLDDIHHTTEMRLQFLGILLGTTLLLWVFVFYPLTKNLNLDIMNTNAMILMIPPETIRENPSLRAFIVEFSKKNAI